MSIFDTIMGKATQAKTQQAAQEAPQHNLPQIPQLLKLQ